MQEILEEVREPSKTSCLVFCGLVKVKPSDFQWRVSKAAGGHRSPPGCPKGPEPKENHSWLLGARLFPTPCKNPTAAWQASQ